MRHGVDVDAAGADAAAVQTAVQAEQRRWQSDTERQRSAAEQAEAVALSRHLDDVDRAAEEAQTCADAEPDEGRPSFLGRRPNETSTVPCGRCHPLHSGSRR